jgi:FkbM family methyltransferase
MDIANKLLFSLLNRARRHRLNRSLFRKALPGLGIGWYGDLDHTGEAALVRHVLPRLAAAPVVFDVGANVGDYASLVRRVRPDARVYAFEPNPKVFPTLARAAAEYGFEAVACAAGAADGETILHGQSGDTTGQGASLSSAVNDTRGSDAASVSAVPLVRLDTWAAGAGLGSIDYLKIDAEGCDLAVVEGLGAFRPDLVIYEFSDANVATRTFMKDFLARLPEYAFHRLVRDGLAPLGDYDPLYWEIFKWQNVVCIRRDGALADMPLTF